MEPVEYLRALRRQWKVIVAMVAVGIIVGWFVSTTVARPGPPVEIYEATTVLLDTTSEDLQKIAPLSKIETIAELGRVGEVPRRVIQRLGLPMDLAAFGERVVVVADPETALIHITATAPARREARLLADAIGEELVAYVEERRTEAIENRSKIAATQIAQLKEEIRALEGRIARLPLNQQQGALTTERDAKVQQVAFLQLNLQELSSALAQPGGSLQVIQRATVVEAPGGFIRPPSSLVGRLLLAAMLGLISGLVVALVLERFAEKIRTKREAEESFALPVLAEIPPVPWWRRRRAPIASLADQPSPSADAYRLLGAGVLRGPSPEHGAAPESGGNGAKTKSPETILVTSPGPGEGKTTVTANLAGSFAALGKKVMVLSCDLRRPAIHRLFGVPNASGLADGLLESGTGVVLDGHVQTTSVANVSLVPSGNAMIGHGELLGSKRMERALAEARDAADIVLLDTSPILTAGDAVHLLDEADTVLVVARAGMTRADHAERTTEILQRMGASIAGVVLNASKESGTVRPYYYREERETRGFPRLARHMGEV